MNEQTERFLTACRDGKIDVVILLLNDITVDPSTENNEAIYWASRKGHSKVVQLLLNDPRVDPSAMNNCAIKWADFYGYMDVIRLLLSDQRISKNLYDYYDYPLIRQIIKEHQHKQTSLMFVYRIIRGTWRYLGPEIAKYIGF